MTKNAGSFDYRKWIIENRHSTLNEQEATGSEATGSATGSNIQIWEGCAEICPEGTIGDPNGFQGGYDVSGWNSCGGVIEYEVDMSQVNTNSQYVQGGMLSMQDWTGDITDFPIFAYNLVNNISAVLYEPGYWGEGELMI